MAWRNNFGLSAVRPQIIASEGPDGVGMSGIAACTSALALLEAQAEKSAAVGRDLPGPMKNGSTMWAKRTFDIPGSSICLQWYHPIDRFGAPQHTIVTLTTGSVVDSAAGNGAPTVTLLSLQRRSQRTNVASNCASVTSLNMRARPIPTGNGKRIPSEFLILSSNASLKKARVNAGWYVGSPQLLRMKRMRSRSLSDKLPKTLDSTVMNAMSVATASPCINS
mmetsp:Transcript_114610/g.186835  ORF Transcript_114610/g.186835 Transcript_114610/m.186835 type:complete len:222 (+) Transcript_114610:861-1526(+)